MSSREEALVQRAQAFEEGRQIPLGGYEALHTGTTRLGIPYVAQSLVTKGDYGTTRFTPNNDYPANIPRSLRTCLERGRAQLSQE